MACVQNCSGNEFDCLKAEYSKLAQKPFSEAFLPSLEGLSLRAVDCAKKALSVHVPELFTAPQGVAIVCTGSDSRLEKCGLGSPLECILVTPKKALSSLQEKIVDKVLRVFSESSGLIYSFLDKKGLDQDLVSTYESFEVRVIPTRAFDAQLVAGDECTFGEYKKKLYSELNQNTVDLKKFKDFFLKPTLQNLRQELSNSPKKNPLLTLDSGKVYYDPKKGRGLKHDILRAVQYSIAFVLFRMIQDNRLSFEECGTIPSTIVGRLRWLEERKITPLTGEQYATITRNYIQTSYWYTQLNSKVMSENGGSDVVTVMQFDPHQLRQVVHETHELCKIMIEER